MGSNGSSEDNGEYKSWRWVVKHGVGTSGKHEWGHAGAAISKDVTLHLGKFQN